MNNKRVARSSRLSETRSTWEDKGSSEVAAGKLEVMEKFFTPVPQSGSQRRSKNRSKDSSWDGAKRHYFKESSSSPSTSSSPWSSESNFRVHPQFRGYSFRASHSRSCNDLYSEKGRGNDDKRDAGKRDISHVQKMDRDKADNYSPQRSGGGARKKSPLKMTDDAAPNSRRAKEDKRMLKNGGRRARSMEALAGKETSKQQGQSGKRVTKEKQRFSQFLDEITIQVLSPSNLNSLGVKDMQNTSSHDQWKNSSTDSSGSRGNKSQCTSVEEQQEVRRKGKGKLAFGTRKKVGGDALEPWRRREMSTSPDSISSSSRQKGDRENLNRGISTASHQPRRMSRRMSQEKVQKTLPQLERENKDVALGTSVLKGKTANVEQAQNRIKATFSGAQSPSKNQEANINFSTVSEQDKDCLNQKITDLLDHLVRAQSTICALEKLNVASLLHHLPADVLKSVNIPHEGPDGSIQTEGKQDLKSPTAMSTQLDQSDISSGNIYTRADKPTESTSAARLTAFTPWSPTKQKSFPAFTTLYTSTESECSLEDAPPTCRLLSPRFPNLGESFSDEWKDDQKTNGYDTRSGQKRPEAPKSSVPAPSLLPAHRPHQRVKHVRGSSTESSGDDQLLNWTDAPSYEPSLNYQSAQNILDTLLRLKTNPGIINASNPEMAGEGFSCVDASTIDGHIIRNENRHLNNPKNIATWTDTKQVSYSMMNDGGLYTSDQRSSPSKLFYKAHSTVSSPADDIGHRLHPADRQLPPIPAKRSSVPLPDTTSKPCEPFTLKSPSGHESDLGNWKGREHQQKGPKERKPKKERTVTFCTMDESKQTPATEMQSASVGHFSLHHLYGQQNLNCENLYNSAT
ncbi:uncharacterized protein PAF06_015461 [Gastrophryne carolinensis]